MADNWENLKSLSKWRDMIMYNWSNVAIKDIRMDNINEIEIGVIYHAEVDLFLGELLVPEDVMVEAYYGRLDPAGNYIDSHTSVMSLEKDAGNKLYVFSSEIEFDKVGHFGINIRVTPNHPNPEIRHAMGLVIWGEG